MAVEDEPNQEWRWQPLREIAGSCLLAMELLAAVFWYTVIARGYKPLNFLLVLVVIGIFFAGAFWLERFSQSWQTSPAKRRTIIITLLFFSMWVALESLVYFPALPGPITIFTGLFRGFADQNLVPLEFWTLIVVMLVWGRGLALAHAPTDTDRVISSFLLIMLSLLAYQFFPQTIEPGTMSAIIFMIVLLGLVSLGSIRIAVITEMRGGKQTLATQGWLRGLGASAFLVAGLTALLSWVVRGPAGQLVIHIFAIFLAVIGSILSLALYPISHLVAAMIGWLQGLFVGVLQNNGVADLLNRIKKMLPEQAPEKSPLQPLFDAIKPVTLWSVIILIALGVLLAIGLQVYRERKRRLDAASSVLAPVDILRDLAEAARQRARELADDLARRFRNLPGARLLQAMRIRWIYAELMALCADLKRPRQGAVTPLEFLADMVVLFDGAAVDLETITHAYLRVRYGELPETSQELQAVTAAWERVKTMGKKLKS